MGYSANFSLVRTNLNYETETPYIKGSQLLHTTSYGGRKWAFDIQDSLALSVTDSNWTKMALFLEDSEGEGLSQIHYVTDNFTGTGQLFSTSGYARLFIIDPPPTVIPDYTNEGWGPLGRNFTFNCSDYSSYTLENASYETNVPVFETYTDAMAYINGIIDISDALNYYTAPTEVEGTKQFNIYCDHCSGTWAYGDEVTDEEHIDYRFMQIWVAPNANNPTPNFALIKDPQLNELRCSYKVYGDIEMIRVSYDGGNSWTEVSEIPWDYFYYPRTTELGSLHYDALGGGNALLYDDETSADTGDPTNASNYGDKSQYYNSTNKTGTEETETTLGTTNYRSFFQQLYILDKAQLQDIALALFDTGEGGLWEDIKRGLDMFGDNPISAVAGLSFYNFNLLNIFSTTSANSIFFGGYELENIPCNLVRNFNGYIDLPAVNLIQSFPDIEDYRNYEPYCKVSIYLPFLGIKALNFDKYMATGGDIQIRYYFDLTTGGVMAVLRSGGLLMDTFTGNCAVNCPITLTDYSAYTSSQIRNLFDVGSSITGATLGAGLSASTGNPIGVASSVIGGGISVASSAFNIAGTKANNFNQTKGSATPLLNNFMPSYAFLIFEIIETEPTSNLSRLLGNRSNASGSISSFSGYLQVESVDLQCPDCVESERQEIIRLLSSGVYI